MPILKVVKRFAPLFAITGAVGAVAGFILGLFFFPFLFPPPKATERLAATERPALVASGSFLHVNRFDPIHYGKGRVSVYRHLVFLESDFEVGPGPAYHVYLVPKAQVRSRDDIADAMYVDLGPLRAFQGSQRYPIPDGVDLAKYQSVVIWCERFSVLISPADLAPAP